MAVERLVEEIKKLTPKQKEELFRKLGITLPIPENKELRGGPDDPLAELIGMLKGPGTGSRKYKEDLYGGAKDLYKLFIDTGAFIALIDERDSMHQASKTFYASLSKRTNLMTSIMVISETYTWLRYHAGRDLAIRFLDIIDRSEKAGALQVILPDNGTMGKVHAVLKKYHDQDLSYTDAVSFVILEIMNIQDVFGFDSHFYIIKRNLWPSVKPGER